MTWVIKLAPPEATIVKDTNNRKEDETMKFLFLEPMNGMISFLLSSMYASFIS